MSLANRTLYTGDCTYLFEGRLYHPHDGGAYNAQVFHDHVNLLADSGVDTVLVNPNGQLAYYPSRAFPRLLNNYKRGDRNYFRAHALHCHGVSPGNLEAFLDEEVKFYGHYLELEDAGVDWVAEMTAACRRRNVSPWLSVRMNDIHGAGDPEQSFMNCDLYRDPANRLKGSSFDVKDGSVLGWQALNYELPHVRQYMMTLIRELVNDYDYEGLELDWLRNPQCCEPMASQSAVDMMTAWHAEIRALVDERARQTGKPFYMGMRVPGYLGMLRSVGIDVVDIARRGLIDFVSPSNFWQTSWDMPHDELRRALGDKVTIYGVIEDAPNWFVGYSPKYQRTGARMLSASSEMLRGNAAGKLALGAEGIEVFNFFCTDSNVWQETLEKEGAARYETLGELADLDGLRGKPKHYALSSSGQGTWYPPFELPEQLPAVLEPQSRRAFKLSMCREPVDRDLALVIQVIIETPVDTTARIGVSFNGSWPEFESSSTDRFLFPVGIYTHIPEGYIALNYVVSTQDIQEGWNEVTLYNHAMLHELVTTGVRPGKADRVRDALRIMSVELGVMPTSAAKEVK